MASAPSSFNYVLCYRAIFSDRVEDHHVTFHVTARLNITDLAHTITKLEELHDGVKRVAVTSCCIL